MKTLGTLIIMGMLALPTISATASGIMIEPKQIDIRMDYGDDNPIEQVRITNNEDTEITIKLSSQGEINTWISNTVITLDKHETETIQLYINPEYEKDLFGKYDSIKTQKGIIEYKWENDDSAETEIQYLSIQDVDAGKSETQQLAESPGDLIVIGVVISALVIIGVITISRH